jgi:hypothetical protein
MSPPSTGTVWGLPTDYWPFRQTFRLRHLDRPGAGSAIGTMWLTRAVAVLPRPAGSHEAEPGQAKLTLRKVGR